MMGNFLFGFILVLISQVLTSAQGWAASMWSPGGPSLAPPRGSSVSAATCAQGGKGGGLIFAPQEAAKGSPATGGKQSAPQRSHQLDGQVAKHLIKHLIKGSNPGTPPPPPGDGARPGAMGGMVRVNNERLQGYYRLVPAFCLGDAQGG